MCWQDAILLPCHRTPPATSAGTSPSCARPGASASSRSPSLAGIPRATWANLESGAANPTLAVLVGVAQALQVRLEELIEPPRRSGRLYPACRRCPCASAAT